MLEMLLAFHSPTPQNVKHLWDAQTWVVFVLHYTHKRLLFITPKKYKSHENAFQYDVYRPLIDRIS